MTVVFKRSVSQVMEANDITINVMHNAFRTFVCNSRWFSTVYNFGYRYVLFCGDLWDSSPETSKNKSSAFASSTDQA